MAKENKSIKKKVLAHLKEDTKEFRKHIAEDKRLKKQIKKSKREYV